ncbi:hypothetical protein AVEN_235639-1 [Araneus ventricosus]|uniref:Reverse transcriptase domain-containing protein n=1 Tax=Araneus ventricosus TaxID=182803 RepID=A0A4Y2BTW0_ARAVE|nr:hypothetical protein AVEN_235639-1 [Araneus ventricosus]
MALVPGKQNKLKLKLPTAWRKAIVVSIPKVGKDPQNPSNYRPIALTSCLCKLMERMVNKRLVYILEKKTIILNFRVASGTVVVPKTMFSSSKQQFEMLS